MKKHEPRVQSLHLVLDWTGSLGAGPGAWASGAKLEGINGCTFQLLARPPDVMAEQLPGKSSK